MSGLKRPAPVNPEETAIEPAEKRIKVDPEHSPTSTSASTNPSLFIKTNSPVDDTPEIELSGILSKPTALQKLLALASLPDPLPAFQPVCPLTTTTSCPTSRTTCPYAHYDLIHRPWTEPRLGQCSYLNTCFGDPAFANNPSLAQSGPSTRPGASASAGPGANGERPSKTGGTRQCSNDIKDKDIKDAPDKHTQVARKRKCRGEKESQWLNMDVRQLDESVLGKFELILADPPWDIHMNLPYALLTDDDLRLLPIPSLQPTWGLLALWVTGRAMELARELFVLWGYRRVDEVVWVKTNQLGGLVRTGRTGHWLNHTCEHLLLAVKLPPASEFPDRSAPIPWDDPALAHLRRGIDGNVVVSEVRETSRKPDEVYGLLERMVPSGRKLEIFGRKHNTRPGWLTIGNQLGDSKIVDPELQKRVDEAKILLDDISSGVDKRTKTI